MASLSGRAANFMSKYLPGLGRMGTRRQVEQFRSSKGRKGSEFLGKPVPDEPFPHVNSTEEFKTLFAS